MSSLSHVKNGLKYLTNSHLLSLVFSYCGSLQLKYIKGKDSTLWSNMSVQHHVASKWKIVDLLSFAPSQTPSLENKMFCLLVPVTSSVSIQDV